MTVARLRLVDEAKVDEAKSDTTTDAPAGAESAPDAGSTRMPSSRRRKARGGAATSQHVTRGAAKAAAPSRAARPRPGKRRSTVADLMRSPVVCCRLSDTLHEAARLMWEHDVGVLVVVDDQGRPRHVITDRDVCMGVYTQGVPLWASRVTSVNPRPIVVCPFDTGVAEARQLMREHGVRRIPVVDGAGNPVGMLGIGDLVREATASAFRHRTRGLTSVQVGQTLAAVYEDVPVPADRAVPR